MRTTMSSTIASAPINPSKRISNIRTSMGLETFLTGRCITTTMVVRAALVMALRPAEAATRPIRQPPTQHAPESRLAEASATPTAVAKVAVMAKAAVTVAEQENNAANFTNPAFQLATDGRVARPHL